MQIEQSVKDDVFTSASIELERLFTVLVNLYNKPEHQEHARLLPEIETTFKATLETLKTSNVPK